MHAVHTCMAEVVNAQTVVFGRTINPLSSMRPGRSTAELPGERCSMSVEGQRVQTVQASAYAIDYISNITQCIQSMGFTSIHA